MVNRSVKPVMHRVKHIHFIGIGGVGMSGIAQVLIDEGYHVSGSDLSRGKLIEALEAMGATCYIGHAAEHIAGADVVVYSSAVMPENPEYAAAQQARIPLVPRAQMLAELMRFRQGIAIAGTHGKTTTTSLVATIFAAANLDPTFVIGGKLNSADANARLGQGEYLIAEADESDASFLYLNPLLIVTTNIDADHMATYHNDFAELENTFLSFFERVPFYGRIMLCLDDPVIERLLPRIRRPVTTYGFHEGAELRIVSYRNAHLVSYFECLIDGQRHEFCLNIPGRHNVLNATAAIGVALHEGIPVPVIQEALAHFAGVGRRFQHQRLTFPSGVMAHLIDDYGHHPRELKVTVDAIRESFAGQRLVMVFQPHRYTRTKDLFEDFVEVLSDCDQLVLLEVYAAGEEPIPGADSRALMRAIRARAKAEPIFVQQLSEVTAVLQNLAQPNDVILMQGAGNIGALAQTMVQTYVTPSIAQVGNE